MRIPKTLKDNFIFFKNIDALFSGEIKPPAKFSKYTTEKIIAEYFKCKDGNDRHNLQNKYGFKSQSQLYNFVSRNSV